MNIKADKAGQQESRRRIKFVIKSVIFIVLIFLRLRYPNLFKEDSEPTDAIITIDNLINAIIFYITAHLIISFSRLSLVAVYLRRQHQQTGFRDNFIIGINQISNLLSYIILGLSFLLLFSIEPKEFFTSISIIAAAIAILFKDYITNMINGLILMFSDQISINDHIKIGDHIGKIVDITLLNVHLLSEDDDLIYIANTTILTGNIINLTKNNQKKIILEFTLHPDQIEGLNELERHLCESLENQKEHIKSDSMQLRVVNINSNNVTIKFQLILNKQSRKMEREIRRHLNWQIIHFIKESRQEETYKFDSAS